MFMDEFIKKMNSPYLIGILQFGFNIPYSTLKNYHNESRLLPEDLFSDMCRMSGFDKSSINFSLINENWGKIKGGKKSKRNRLT